MRILWRRTGTMTWISELVSLFASVVHSSSHVFCRRKSTFSSTVLKNNHHVLSHFLLKIYLVQILVLPLPLLSLTFSLFEYLFLHFGSKLLRKTRRKILHVPVIICWHVCKYIHIYLKNINSFKRYRLNDKSILLRVFPKTERLPAFWICVYARKRKRFTLHFSFVLGKK